MQVNLKGMEVWDAINPGGGVPPEMWLLLAKNKTTKETWESVRSMRVVLDRVKVANAQRLMMEFENITFKEVELIDEFGMRIESQAEKLCAVGETITDARVAKKILRVLLKKFSQIVVSIETLLDINSLMVEGLVSHLRSSEDRVTIDSVTEQTSR
jgi:hypothetical protein